MTIQEILEDHLRVKGVRGLETLCICGWHTAQRLRPEDLHRAHLAEVLEKHMQEREAGALESFVASQRQMLENMETFADEYDRDEVDRWCSVITNRAKEIRELTNGR